MNIHAWNFLTPQVHAALAHFFSVADDRVVDHARLCEELPFQLMHSRQHGKLKAFCLDIRHFRQVSPTLARI